MNNDADNDVYKDTDNDLHKDAQDAITPDGAIASNEEDAAAAAPERPDPSVRFRAAMVVYILLAVLAGATLDGVIRIATWVFLGGLALKSYLVVLRHRADQ